VPVAKPTLTTFLDLRFGTRDAGRAQEAEAKCLAALDRLEAELGDRDHLVGDTFTVADLTAASLLYPLALPPECPWRPKHLPEAWVARLEDLRDRRATDWVTETYARWRVPATACQANTNWTGKRAQSAHAGVPG
jgi:glutathione S-transferase